MYLSEGICFEIGKGKGICQNHFLLQYIHFHTLQKKLCFFKNLEQGLLPCYSLGNPFSFYCHLPF